LAWRIHGQGAREAARALLSIPSIKQEQLFIASQWPKAEDDRALAKSRLHQLKHSDVPSFCVESWEYLAGFFDAEGCIRIPPVYPGVRLAIGQKHPAVLRSISTLIRNALPGYTQGLCRNGHAYSLQVSKTAASKLVLERLITAGLLQKRPAAEIALAVDKSNHILSRQRLATITGNQGRYQRLDADGCKRAHSILLIQNRVHGLRRAGATTTAVQRMQIEISSLQKEHAHLSALASLSSLRHDIRQMLKQGAWRFPSSQG